METLEQTLKSAQEHQDAGRLPEAEAGYRQVIAGGGDSKILADAYDGLAAILQDRGEIDQAVAASRKVVELTRSAEEAYALADTLERMRRFDDAAEMFAFAAELDPEMGEAHARLGTLSFARGKIEQAIASYQRAVDVRPGLAEAHSNLAAALHQAGKPDAALEAARRAIAVKPNLPEAHNVIGIILMERHRLADAASQFIRAAELRPDFAEAINNIGSVLTQLGRFDEAAAQYERAVKLRAQAPKFHEDLAHNLLLRGDYARGWAEMEWRRANAWNPASRKLPMPQWDGSDLSGQTIVLHAERHVSDTIQFARYVPLVAERNAKVIVECQESIAPLIKRMTGVEQVVVQGQALPAFDRHSPLMTLPLIFRTTVENVPARVPYLSPDSESISKWAERLPARDGKMRVGLTWSGSPRQKNDRHFSYSPALLEMLSELKDVTFVSLQKEAAARPPESFVMVDFAAELGGFDDTAAVVSQLDLVITVDSAVAHLAGAMGKPVWVMVPFSPDWRWLINREDSPWYPTMKLFRQKSAKDWRGVMERIAGELAGEFSRFNARAEGAKPGDVPDARNVL